MMVSIYKHVGVVKIYIGGTDIIKIRLIFQQVHVHLVENPYFVFHFSLSTEQAECSLLDRAILFTL